MEFDNAYLFKYSPRKDTPAAAMPDQLPEELIEERHARLLELVNEIGKRKYEAFVARQVQILVEGPSRKNEARMMGRTPCNKIVLFDGIGAPSRSTHGRTHDAHRFVHALRRSRDSGL